MTLSAGPPSPLRGSGAAGQKILGEVRDVHAIAVGQRQLAVLARVFELAQSIDDSLQPTIRIPCRFLPHHFDRGLVVAQAEIDRMPQLVVGGPLREADLRDEIGPHPVRRLVRLDRARRTATSSSRAPSAASTRAPVPSVESGAGVADVLQPPAFLHAEQQRAEVLPRLARLGPAADDELLLLDELDLAPCGGTAARLVRGRRLLGDQSFPAFLDRPFVQRRRIVGHLLAEADDAGVVLLE